MMNYDEAVEWLYVQLPAFHSAGAGAYKPGLQHTLDISAAFGNPHLDFPVIHVAGTNGKGSTSHTLAAILHQCGYRTGLYTSPHLLDFRERMRVDGKMIPKERVISFVEKVKEMNLDFAPSFFEMTTIMAFKYFSEEKVDVAVVEVGLGGRLDSTNIVNPHLSIITNISLDHTDLLGDTRAAIAAEKAGIIKRGVPVVIGESDEETTPVFNRFAGDMQAPIVYAEQTPKYSTVHRKDFFGGIAYEGTRYGNLVGELSGECQTRNTATILTALEQLEQLGYNITPEAVKEGFSHVCRLTGLMGRWMKLSAEPLAVCDTGHNEGGWHHIVRQLNEFHGAKRLVLGFVGDKDVRSIMSLIAGVKDCRLILTAPAIPRAMELSRVTEAATEAGLEWEVTEGVAEAYKKALTQWHQGEMIYVGGSTYVVAELLEAVELGTD